MVVVSLVVTSLHVLVLGVLAFPVLTDPSHVGIPVLVAVVGWLTFRRNDD